MSEHSFIILSCALAFFITMIIYPIALKIAFKYHIVDNPNARKLQKRPVPVLGGLPVTLGILIPTLMVSCFMHSSDLLYVCGAILLLCIIGISDDIKNVPAWIRFVLEITIIWVLIWRPYMPDNGPMIENLFGLWGREHISVFTAMPLTIIGGVGIINAINLIDGVDGYSSGFGIVANILFATVFFVVGDVKLGVFSLISAMALLPFYFHNVFGDKMKMFIGDGGSLVIGMVLTYNIFSIFSPSSPCMGLEEKGIGVVAMTIAIMCIPVFDTLRVMFARIIVGHSPFSPDKTHLHHLFIDLGFSHVGTSLTIILTNLLIVLIWFVSWRLGASIDLQFYIVILLGLLTTSGFYYGMRVAEKKQNKLYHTICRIGARTHFEKNHIWALLQKIMDR